MNEPLMCCVLNSWYRCCLCKKDICVECYKANQYTKATEPCPRRKGLDSMTGQHVWAGTIAFTK